jgi:hypothetical protein
MAVTSRRDGRYRFTWFDNSRIRHKTANFKLFDPHEWTNEENWRDLPRYYGSIGEESWLTMRGSADDKLRRSRSMP